MLRNVIAPSRDFTQIANTLVWDESLSDAAFRLLVRSLALPPSQARSTTVTELAAGLSGGRITVDRARRQLTRAGLLHSTRWRNATGQVRTESLVSNVPLTEADAERLFADHFGRGGGGGGPRAGRRGSGGTTARGSGTALPAGEDSGEEKTSPLPVPVRPPELEADEAEAERVLRSLRRTDPRLVLGAAEVRRLLPLAAEWLARGVSSASMLYALTAGLPQQVKSPAALVQCRLRDKMPEAARAVPLTDCEGCERAFRPVNGEQQCGSCRRKTAAAAPGLRVGESGARIGWRERVGMVAPS
ncbi:hypothetical protein [Kitasatospora sp. MAP5-34]|uniref:hypothetical protein n=1 Tax=Kitasatospora sp. MAP5-34 TaxID=3035102 RepID=UPI0024741C4A|nr:hypothetical protein [Kitasatospora sp. MAP5-34]MDH6576622.1 hypothetical protein [Kitasatospora sp. MAP5-34]